MPYQDDEFDFKEDYTLIKGNSKRVIVTYGRLYSEACKAKKINPEINILKLNKIFPLNDNLVDELSKFEKIDFYEEVLKSGGISEHLSSLLFENGYNGRYKTHAIDNEFVGIYSVSKALNVYELDYSAMLKDGE